MKKLFTTGLIILLPVALTLMLVSFLVNVLTNPFLGVVKATLERYHLLKTPFFSHPEVVLLLSKLLILFFLFLTVLLIGVVGRWIFIRYVIHLTDSMMHRIPLINKVYKASQDVVHTVLAPGSTTFQQVVLVPFPNTKGLSIGLITKEKSSLESAEGSQDLISVFVPGTPNPTMGFMLLYRKEQVTYTDITVEQALKCVISCGVIISSFSAKKEPV